MTASNSDSERRGRKKLYDSLLVRNNSADKLPVIYCICEQFSLRLGRSMKYKLP
jgi:hypothetical protein